ncbi:hypothetical protein JCM10449v2_001113 [Rhodotorula kratochvilovae]
MHSFLSFALVALPLAASAVASTAHYSHPRRGDLAGHKRAAHRFRALPRSGRRLAKRGEANGAQATLKCLSEYTFALCDGDNCTDMGAVAAGTMCKDGAITWDTSSEASSDDSAAATTSYAEIPSPSAAAVEVEPTTTSAAPAVEETLTADKKLANNAAVQSSSSSSSAPAAEVTAVQLNAAGSSSSSSDSNDRDDWVCDSDDGSSAEEDWVCDSEDETPSASASAAAATTTSWSAPSSSSSAQTSAAPSSSYAAADNVQLFQTSKAASTTQAPKTTTTTSSAPAQTSSASSSGSSDTFSGRGTYYLQYGVAGSCGSVHSDSDYIVALSYTQVDSGSHCGQKVLLTNADNGKSVEATVADTCPGCEYGAIDLSEGAFLQLGTLDQGVLNLEWHFE